ncbi:MAG: glycosyltransferase family 4 protein [Actinomycetota bacterium]|nr:glycosyltransferase family 4 protein [Actinomycetota bacterium]
MSHPLRHVALNAVFLAPQMGGMVTYTTNLVAELVRARPDVHVTVYVSERGARALREEPWRSEVELLSHPALGRPYVSALSEMAVLPRLMRNGDAQLLHSLAMTGPLRAAVPHVVTVPDLIWRRFPSSGRLTIALWRAIVPPVVRRARRVVTYSDASRRDIVSLLGVETDRVDVIPLGSDGRVRAPAPATDVRVQFGLGEGPVVLAVSSKKPHKNLLRLTEAMGSVSARHPGAVLVVPGSASPHDDELRSVAERSGARLVLPGWVDETQLEGLYATAACAAFPSLQEGFGLPILEAMHRGVPVACSNASSLPEVGGDAVSYFDPRRVPDIAGAVMQLLDSPDRAAALVRAGHERARTFTWEAVARRHIETYEHALAET